MNRKWMYLVGFLLLVFVAFYVYKKYRVAPTIDLSQLNLSDLEGKPVTFDSFNGKKKLVLFSASWCPNCLMELKDIFSIRAELADVEILVISDEPLEVVNAFKESRNYPFTFLKLTRPFNEIGIYSIPVSYVVNTKQKVMKETVGYLDWKDPSTREHLKKLMD